MRTLLIPYDTAEEKRNILNVLKEYNEDENRLWGRIDWVIASAFNSYKHKNKPRGDNVITWTMDINEKGCADFLAGINCLLRQSHTAYVMTHLIQDRIYYWFYDAAPLLL